jgi:hypothetical protein
VIPQALALIGNERAYHLRHLLEIGRKIAQVWHGFAPHGHPMTRPISVTGVHPSAFRWIHENMFNQLFMQIRRCERWRVALHSRLTIIVGADFRQDHEPALFWALPRRIDGVTEDSPAEVPGPKVKQKYVLEGTNDVLAPRQCYWAIMDIQMWIALKRTHRRNTAIRGL